MKANPKHRIPVAVIGTISPLIRDLAVLALLADTPGLAVVQQDLDPARPGEVRRVVHTTGGTISDTWVALDHSCTGCGSREDAVRAIRETLDIGAFRRIALALPVAAQTASAAGRVARATAPGEALMDCHLASVIAPCDLATFEHDLLGDDLLVERGRHLSPDDSRSMGEVLAAIVEHADFVLTLPDRDAGQRPVALVDHVRAPDSHRVDEFLASDLSSLFDHTHHADAAYRRIDPLSFESRGTPPREGVWSLSLASNRPFHPERLMNSLESLGGRRTRSRGHFWLPTRPFSACQWDGAGGQLSIGNHGEWRQQTPGTRLRFTGVDAEQQDIIDAFDHALLTRGESMQSVETWFEAHDPFDDWLGRRNHG